MHIVSFDDQGKIAQIRQSWDQGALLKAVEVIGRSGRNWPIRDHTEQLRALTTCIKSPDVAIASADSFDARSRSRGSSNAMRDPHASLELFASREQREQAPERVVSPYAGTRPRERSITQILGEESDDEEGSATRGRSQSPSKAIAPKAGAGKNYKPNRLFTEEEEDEETPGRGRSMPVAPKAGGKKFQPNRLFDAEQESPEPDTPPNSKAKTDRVRRPHPTKYNHFEFGDPEDPPKIDPATDRSRSRSKHDSSWSFDDFVTPQKPLPSKTIRPQDVRHWDAEADAASDTPGPFKVTVKPRRDAEHHFDFVDDGPEQPGRRAAGIKRGSKHNTGLGLYDNNLYNEDGSEPAAGADPSALGNITNLKGRKNDFDSHWAMTDEDDVATPQPPKVSDDRKKAVRMMESNWAATDESPVGAKENAPLASVSGRKQAGINVAGDGMGSRKVNRNGGSDRSDGRGIHIAGDGMGGKKGTARDWLYPEDD